MTQRDSDTAVICISLVAILISLYIMYIMIISNTISVFLMIFHSFTILLALYGIIRTIISIIKGE